MNYDWKLDFFCVHKLAYCALQCRHNGRDGVSNHQPHDCLFNHILKVLIKENIKAPRPWLCAENSPVTGEFPAQRASNAENVSIWWRHHVHKIAYCVWFHLQHRLSFIFSTCRWQRPSIWFIAFIVRTVTVLCLIVKSLQRIWTRVGTRSSNELLRINLTVGHTDSSTSYGCHGHIPYFLHIGYEGWI